MASFASSATTGGARKHAWTNKKLGYAVVDLASLSWGWDVFGWVASWDVV